MRKWERGLELPPDNVLQALATLFDVPAKVLEESQKWFAQIVAPGEGYTTAVPNGQSVQRPLSLPPSERISVVDLFCGAGGFSLGLELTDRFAVVAGIDLMPDRIATFRANHPHSVSWTADIREIPIEELADRFGGVDLVVGGPPCQGFSSIRPFRTLTEGDTRNSLTEHFLLAVSAIGPRWFVFENVVGVLTHNQGQVLKGLISGFESIGYCVSWRIMNAALYGVPQNRERLVLVGNRVGVDYSWPSPRYFGEYRSMAGQRPEVIRTEPLFDYDLPHAICLIDAIWDLPDVEAGESASTYKSKPQNEFQAWSRNDCTVLSLHEATKHSPHMLSVIRHSGANISSIPKNMVKSGFSSCYSRLDANSPSTTLTVNFVHPASNRCIHPFQDRALTPREGARIQSFPDRFQFHGTRAQIVKQIGNAVPPLLAKAIGEGIIASESLTSTENENSHHPQALSHTV